MHPVFSIYGKHVAWLFNEFVYNTNGYPIGYLSGNSIFSTKNSQYIGQLESGDYFTWRRHP